MLCPAVASTSAQLCKCLETQVALLRAPLTAVPPGPAPRTWEEAPPAVLAQVGLVSPGLLEKQLQELQT